MPRRVDPRANWRATLQDQPDPYTDENYHKIANALRYVMTGSLTEGEVEALRQSVREHALDFLEVRHQTEGPGRPEIRLALTRLKKAAESFRSAVAELNDYSLALLRIQDGWFKARLSELVEQGLSPAEITSNNALGPVDQILTEAEQALSRLQVDSEWSQEELLSLPLDFGFEPNARRRRNPVDALVYGLSDVFRRVTGEEPVCYWDNNTVAGNFLPFVMACLTPIDNRLREHGTLEATVRSVLREQRDLGFTRIE